MKLLEKSVLRLLAVGYAGFFFPASPAFAHSGALSTAAWDACDGKLKSTTCEYAGFHDERYKGSCQLMSAQLMCVRNQPIEYADTATKP